MVLACPLYASLERTIVVSLTGSYAATPRTPTDPLQKQIKRADHPISRQI